MTTLYSSYFLAKEGGGSPYTCTAPMPSKPGEVVYLRGTVTVSSNLATSDKIRFTRMPKGSRLAMFAHQWSDLDGSTTAVADLGMETTNQDAYLAASTIYRSADTTLASGEGSNILTEWSTELVADAEAASVDDYLTLTITTGATSLPATATITFSAMIYLP